MTATVVLPAEGGPQRTASVVARFPCTQPQQSFWILEQIAPGNSAANMALRWELRGRFRAESIEAAFREVIARHEILRTRFVEEDGTPIQEVVEHCEFKLPVVDLRTVPADQMEARIEAIGASEATTPFDLARPGLIRATLLQLAADRALILTTVHHLCCDGYSIPLLAREVGEIAAALDAGRRPGLPELALQYGDYALWQAASLEADGLETERRYWQNRLRGASYFEVPTDRPRGAERTHVGASAFRLLSPAVSARIDAFARSEKMSVFGVAVSVLAIILHRRTGECDIGIGAQVAEREDSTLENLVGVFINTLVLRVAVDPDLSFREYLRGAGETVQEALLHRRMPFNTLVGMLNPPRDAARTPLISVNLAMQHKFLEDRRYGEFELVSHPSTVAGSLVDLNFLMIGRPEGWRVGLEYNCDLFEPATAEALLSDWVAALDRLTADPSMRLSDLPRAGGRPAGDAGSPSTVETWLASHPAVKQAGVFDAPNGERRALAVPSPDFERTLDELPGILAAYLAARLAPAALPGSIRLVMRLPAASGASLAAPPTVGEPTSAAGLEDQSRFAGIETEVSALWCDLLGLASVDRTTSFFDLGGHSLLAVRLVARLRDRLGIDVNTAVLYRAPTIASLVPKLAACGSLRPATPAREDNRINEINPDAPGIPIISINNYSTIYAISKHFTAPRRCISVRLVDPDAPFERSAESFEAIADAYVALVRQAQPQGPYALFGVCVHGNLALEVARRLLASGEEVAGLFVKDVWAPAYSVAVRNDPAMRRLNRWHDARVRLRQWRRGQLSALDFLRYYRSVRANPFFQAIERLAESRLSQETRLLLTTSQGDFVEHLSAARNRYMPARYPGDIVILATDEAPSGFRFDRSLGWRDVVTGRLEIEEIDQIVAFRGLEIGTQAVAKRMEATLREAESRRTAR